MRERKSSVRRSSPRGALDLIRFVIEARRKRGAVRALTRRRSFLARLALVTICALQMDVSPALGQLRPSRTR